MWRADASAPGGRAIALVHRPAHGDWSLPKGKPHAGEDAMSAAVREVQEETGVCASVQARLGSVAYLTDEGPKLVEHFVLRAHPEGGEAEPDLSGEVDEVRWLAPAEAAAQCTYQGDRDLIGMFAGQPAITATVALVRHAKAGKRSAWDGPDELRPLSRRGRLQSDRLAGILTAVRPQRLLSAPPVRCTATVQPLAERLGLSIETAAWAADDAFDRTGRVGAAMVRQLARTGGVSVVCSQGEAIPRILDALLGPTSDYATAKGAFWLLAFAQGRLVSADHRPAPPA